MGWLILALRAAKICTVSGGCEETGSRATRILVLRAVKILVLRAVKILVLRTVKILVLRAGRIKILMAGRIIAGRDV